MILENMQQLKAKMQQHEEFSHEVQSPHEIRLESLTISWIFLSSAPLIQMHPILYPIINPPIGSVNGTLLRGITLA